MQILCGLNALIQVKLMQLFNHARQNYPGVFHDYVSEIAVLVWTVLLKSLIIHEIRFGFMDFLSKLEYFVGISPGILRNLP